MGIVVQDLTKVYDSQKAIDRINFKVNTGQIVGFLGPNGAGKTTTMKIITCYMPPTDGVVMLEDYNIFDHPLEIRQRIGYLPEHNPLYLDQYVHEYLKYVGKLYKMTPSALQKRIPELIEMTGLQREQHKKIGMLSKGYRQRVGLAQALIHDPPVLILDEPTTGLDPNQIIEIRNLIKEIGREKTIIFSTHILPEVEAIADRVIIINRGKIVADQDLGHLKSSNNAENLLKVEFEKSGFNLNNIQRLEGITEIETEGEKSFTFRTTKQLDLRRTIFEESLLQENPIEKLARLETSLEEIFRKLTQE